MNKNMFDLRFFDVPKIGKAEAGALIPTQEAQGIIDGVVEKSIVLSQGYRLPNMTSRTLRQKVLDTLPQAYFVNGEAGMKQTTSMSWDDKFITAEEIAVIVAVPEDVIDDAEYDIWGQVKPRITEAFGRKIDEAILYGMNKPASWRNGLLTDATAAGNVVSLAGQNDLYDAIMGVNGVIAKVEEDGYFVSGHVADISMRAKLRGLRDTTGQPIFRSDMQSGTNYTLDGSRIEFPRNGVMDKSKSLMISGDFSQLTFAIRQDMTFKLFTEGVIQDPSTKEIVYNLMQNDMVALRAVMRLGWEIPNPINLVNDDPDTRFPFAVLTA